MSEYIIPGSPIPWGKVRRAQGLPSTPTVRVRARERAFLLNGERVEPGEWRTVSRAVAMHLRAARGPDIELEGR